MVMIMVMPVIMVIVCDHGRVDNDHEGVDDDDGDSVLDWQDSIGEIGLVR